MKHFFISLIFLFIVSLSFAQPIKLSIDNFNSNELKVGDSLIVNLNVEKFSHKITALQVFLEFDQTVLRYVNTVEVNEIFKSAWQENKTENFYTGLFLDFTRLGIVLENDGVICKLLFVYEGGETDLVWGTSDKVLDGVKLNGKTTFLNLENKEVDLTLIDGCVCNQ